MSVNKVILIGHLGRDAEVRYTKGGQAVASLNLATTEQWNDREGQRQERTEWHRVIVWGKTAETLQTYLVKGKQLYVEGALTTRQYEKDGEKRYATEIKAHRITLLGGRRRDDDEQGAAGMEEAEPATTTAAAAAADDDDLPF